MTQPPPDSSPGPVPSGTPERRAEVLSYAAPNRRSAWANAAGWVGGLAFLTTCLGIGPIFGVMAIVFGIVALREIRRHPERLSGKDFAVAGIVMGVVSLAGMPFVFELIHPPGQRELPNRVHCAANIRGIVGSMIVYANENGGVYPTAGNPATPLTYSANVGLTVPATDGPSALPLVHGSPAAGNVTACLWILVNSGQCMPKQFMCKSDPAVDALCSPVASGSSQYVTPQLDGHLSYSMAYPWTDKGTVAPWWRDDGSDSVTPILSDMAPLQGTGSPKRDLAPAVKPRDARTWNSPNHAGAGQQVGYRDGHVEWHRNPLAGEHSDNIFSTNSADDGTGGAPITTSGQVPAPTGTNTSWASAPWDIIMVPVRDGATGKIR